MADKDIRCAIGVDLDAVAGWLGSYGGEDSPDDISRGLFAGEVGTPRLLKLFRKFGLTTTWFIPGHSIETFRTEVQMIVDDGHEIGLHGYSHENPIAMDAGNRKKRCSTGASTSSPTLQASGPPDMSRRGGNSVPSLLNFCCPNGVKYDHSLMHKDFECYYVRVGDKWTKIDFEQSADAWMQALERGQETGLVEIPANWYLDDLPPMMFIKKSPNSHGFVNPRDIEQMWRDPVRLRLSRVRRRGLPHYHPSRRERSPAGAADAGADYRLHLFPPWGALLHLRPDSRRPPAA